MSLDESESAPKDKQDEGELAYTDEEFLGLVAEEMSRSIGFENDALLRDKRLTALNYYKGDMTADIPSLPNRSSVVASTISDAVETILPDLMEIFTAGGDVAAFIPTKPEDEEAAQQETDYLNHVIFQDNPGFLNLYSGFKDALLLNTAVFEFGWEERTEDEDFEGKTAQELLLASQSGQIVNVMADDEVQGQEPTYKFTVRTDNSKAVYWALPPDDFSVGSDTVRISDATYCCARYRPREQDLIQDKYDEEDVKKLDAYTSGQTDQVQQARDQAGEHQVSKTSDDATGILRQVEIRKHYLKLVDDSGDTDIWCIATDAFAAKIIHREGKAAWKVDRIPFAVGSPYLVSHRLYGVSLAEMLFELQKINTVLTRALMDSTYFVLNQRNEVAMDQANDYTISDLLRNEPGVPVRSKTGTAIRPLQASGLGFDIYGALEHFATVAEMRTGVVRNAQGLNPDTLHDTAKGAITMMHAAQRRIRMIARILAETCVKELYLGLHATIRENATGQRILKLNGKWMPIDPTKWAERNAMSIEVGLGASGKEMEIAAMQQIIGLQKAGVELQGGAQGPVVKLENLYQSATDMVRKLGIKAVNKYFSDPNDPKNPPPPPQPSPEMMKIQGEMALKKATAEADAAHQNNKLQADLVREKADMEAKQQVAVAEANAKSQTTQHQNQLEHDREMFKQGNQFQLEKLRIESAEKTAIEVARINAEGKISAAMASAKIDQQATLQYEIDNEGTP